MADDGKKRKSAGLFTHWARPRVRTYEYNYEYGESYYRPLVKYISTSSAISSVSSSVQELDMSSVKTSRKGRASSPPRAMSFIERWTNEPFYGAGIGFQSRMSSERSLAHLESAKVSSASEYQYHSQSQQQSQQQSSTSIRQSRQSTLEAAAKYASDDCLMRSTALEAESNRAVSRRAAVASEASACASQAQKTLCADHHHHAVHGKSLDECYYSEYPRQHLVCDENCPLHNNPEWKRKFLIGNRFTDAAALGGFDVLYDPTVYSSSKKLLSKLAECKESDEIIIERTTEDESSRRRIKATIY